MRHREKGDTFEPLPVNPENRFCAALRIVFGSSQQSASLQEDSAAKGPRDYRKVSDAHHRRMGTGFCPATAFRLHPAGLSDDVNPHRAVSVAITVHKSAMRDTHQTKSRRIIEQSVILRHPPSRDRREPSAQIPAPPRFANLVNLHERVGRRH